MNLEGQTILITGGSGGIGFALAGRLAKHNTVIITGRNLDRLNSARAKVPGLHAIQSDASDPGAIDRLFTEVTTTFPALNVLINNAGIMRVLNLRAPNDPTDIVQEIQTNLVAPVQMVQRFVAHLERQPHAAIVNVTSGLAFVSMPACPVYCATKAALHSYTQALRVQLKGTRVQVIELAPPAVDTALSSDFPAGIADPRLNMALDTFADVAIRGLERGTLEIRPRFATVLHTLGRLAPGMTLTTKSAEAVVARVGPNGRLGAGA